MGSNGVSLQFGVELELLIGGRKKAFTTWKALAEDVSKRLLKAGIRNHVNHGRSKTAENYREWSIVPEVTIPSQPGNNLFGIELVSPIYPAAWSWAADLATIYTTVHSAYIVVPSSHCSTHVHVSTTPMPLPELSVVLLAEALLYYEKALDGLMPAGRRDSSTYWCRSNRESHMFKAFAAEMEADDSGGDAGATAMLARGGGGNDLATCLDVVRYGYNETAFSMAEAVNLLPADCAYGRAHGKKGSFVHGKVFKWNFGGLREVAPKAAGTRAGGANATTKGRAAVDAAFAGTIEFRQPPGSVAADEACAWVTLALAFVAGVMAGDGSQASGGQGASLAELWQVLQAGAVELGWSDLGAVDGLFRGSSSGSDN